MNLKYKDKIYNQELFIGNEKNINYFEGWYFKHVDKSLNHSISFIVGISKSEDSHCFIQIIDNIKNKSYYIKYDINDFFFSNNPFYIKIKDNLFSLKKIHINIEVPIKIIVDISYSNLTPITKNFYAPNIMGPFAYLTFMECNHALISIKHKLTGYVEIYDQMLCFDDGLGYIEKDYGVSFPNKYLWLQSNSAKNSSIFLSIANIPFLKMNFKGFICILEINNKQYRFSTYNRGKANIKKINSNNYLIIIKQGFKKLEINLDCSNSMELISPKNGKMDEIVKESLSSICRVKFIIKTKLVFEETFIACGSEIFNY